MLSVDVSFREGGPSDLEETFVLSRRAIHDAAVRQGLLPGGSLPTDAEIRGDWRLQRALVEFTAAQPEGCYWICEAADGPVGYARVVRFGGMEELTELMVRPDRQGSGIGRALLERCWPGDPTPATGRIVIAAGAPTDLSLYCDFGVMPIAGHWHMRQHTEDYLALRTRELDRTEPAVHVLEPERAVREWQRLEPLAIAHERPRLHDFFGRDRICLATVDGSGSASALCWVSSVGEIGPAVARSTEEVVPVVLAALDRVAKTQEPESLSIFCTTLCWWLLRRLRLLGFRVWWPSWIMCSVPLPGLDRYVPTRPPQLL